jgi:hypothetical protein
MSHHRIFGLAPGAVAILLLGWLAPREAGGQNPPDTVRVTIGGRVFERGKGVPISGALIHLAGTDFRARSAWDGRYTIEGIPRGAYQLEVDAPGYRAIRAGMSILRGGDLDFPLEPVSGAARPGHSPRILGRVVERETGAPIEGARITLAGASPGQISDGRGRFEMENPTPGPQTLAVTVLGREPLTALVEVPAEGTLEVDIRLAVEPVEMTPILVTATPRDSYLEAMGFYQRRDEGRSGTQITRQALLDRNPRNLGDILAVVPGIRVLPGALGSFQVRMRRAIRLTGDGGQGCVPALFVDDVRSEPGWLQDLDPVRVEALEIYSGANAPLRYNDGCGVILVWTRRGERGRGGV